MLASSNQVMPLPIVFESFGDMSDNLAQNQYRSDRDPHATIALAGDPKLLTEFSSAAQRKSRFTDLQRRAGTERGSRSGGPNVTCVTLVFVQITLQSGSQFGCSSLLSSEFILAVAVHSATILCN
jgi:hypothetical protein